MPPSWNLKGHLEWVSNSKPYVPQIDLDIPELTSEQAKEYRIIKSRLASLSSNISYNTPDLNRTTLKSANSSNIVQDENIPPSVATSTTNKPSTQNQIHSKSTSSFTQWTLPLKPYTSNNQQEKDNNTPISNKNSNVNINTNLNNRSITPIRGQIQITQLIQKKTTDNPTNNINKSSYNNLDTDSFIDLTQDDTLSNTNKISNNNILPQKRKNDDLNINDQHRDKRKISEFDETDIFSDDEEVEAILAQRESSEFSKKNCSIDNTNTNVRTNLDIDNIDIIKSQLDDNKISLLSFDQLHELCKKQMELINSLNHLNSFLEDGIKIETSTSLSEDQKRNERKIFNPKLEKLKSHCNFLSNNIPKFNNFNVKDQGETQHENYLQKNIPINKDNNIIINSKIDIDTDTFNNNNNNNNKIEQPLQNSVEKNDILNFDNFNNNLDEDEDGDDTDIIVHNTHTEVKKSIDINSTIISSPSYEDDNDNNQHDKHIFNEPISISKPQRTINPPKNLPIWSTQEDEIEDSFNCESEEEPATKTQIRKEMGNFVVSDDDDDNDANSSFDALYKESQWDSVGNEIDDIEEINNSDIVQLHNSEIENIEDVEDDVFSHKSTILEEICDSDSDNENKNVLNNLNGKSSNERPIFISSEADRINETILGDKDDEWSIAYTCESSNKKNVSNNETENGIGIGIEIGNENENENENEDEDEEDDILIIDGKADYFTQLNEERGIDNIEKNLDDDLDDDFPWDDDDEDFLNKLDAAFHKSASNMQLQKSKDNNSNNALVEDEIKVLENPNKDSFKEFHGKHEWTSEIYKTLKNVFNLQSFRENQLNAINATLNGDDVFVLMPTGGGKSLCYQLPAVIESGVTSGVTIVISPLISLMQDQVLHLEKRNIKASMLNSRMSVDDKKHVYNLFINGLIQLMYLSPEMISKSGKCRTAISKLYSDQKLARIVIDEAHCVSSWGHDFRPDYKELKFFKQDYPNIPMMALTATANEHVRADIIEHLGLQNPKFYKQSFNRTNLFYQVLDKKKSVMEDIVSIINSKYLGQTGIIYCHSKNSCEMTAQRLCEFGISCDYYHAGMETSERSRVQTDWQEGRVKVIAATVAFGMGIDKSDVRYVIHLYIPRNLEGYYQETGRAGRDGNHSDCLMFYSMKDARILQSLIRKDRDLDRQSKENYLDKLKQVIQYCENHTDCRRQVVLQYFNEKFNREDCHKQCDNCLNAENVDIEIKDMTKIAIDCVKLVKSIESKNVTAICCQDIIKGAKYAKIVSNGFDKSEYHGIGKEFTKTDVERVFFQLIFDGYLQEKSIKNGAGFSTSYIQTGPNAFQILRGNAKLMMKFSKPKTKGKRNETRDINANSGAMPLTRQTSFRPSSELWNTGNKKKDSSNSNLFNGSGTNVNFSASGKGINVKILSIKDPERKTHLDECYMELRKERSSLATLLELSKESTLASDTMLKHMAFELPINFVAYELLEDYRKEQSAYFPRFSRKIKLLREKRMKLFGTLDLRENQQQFSEISDITEDSNIATHDPNTTRSRFFQGVEDFTSTPIPSSQRNKSGKSSQTSRGKKNFQRGGRNGSNGFNARGRKNFRRGGKNGGHSQASANTTNPTKKKSHASAMKM